MENDWTKIYSTSKSFQAEMIKGMLEENGIHSVVINKQDSSYLVFGESEVYVKRDDVVKAMNLINSRQE